MTTLTVNEWEQRAGRLHIEGRAFIDGHYRDAVGGAVFDCISPVDGRQLARIASCTGEDADAAVKATKEKRALAQAACLGKRRSSP